MPYGWLWEMSLPLLRGTTGRAMQFRFFPYMRAASAPSPSAREGNTVEREEDKSLF